jgi:integrase
LVDCHQHYSEVSVRTFYQILKVLNYCLIDDLELPDAMKGVKSPKVAKKQRRYFSPKELFSIITEPKNSTLDRLIVLCFLDSTARCGELCNLETENVKDGFFVSIGKTGQRKYRLNPQLCEELRELGKGHKYVFRNRFEGPMETKQMYRMTRRIFIRAGLTGEKLGPHTLRHSAASLVAQFTKSPLAVKALLQHDNINTSMIYIHDAEDATAQLVSRSR